MNRLLLLTFLLGLVSLQLAHSANHLMDTVFVQRYDTLCQGDTLKLFGWTYTQTGKYRYNKPPIRPRRDTAIIIHLWVRPRYQLTRYDTLCQGDQLTIGTQSFSSTGEYTVVFPSNKLRCDSVILLRLYVLPIYANRLNVFLCQGDTMLLGANKYYYPTVATLRYNAQNRCDSVVQYAIEMLDTFRTFKDTIVCKGAEVQVGDSTFKANNSGSFYYKYEPNGLRCDSLIELRLQVRDTFLTRIKERICEGQSRQLGPSTLYSPGLYRYSFPPNQFRCDSVVVLELEVEKQKSTVLKRTICEGEVFQIGVEKFSRKGTYLINLQTKTGCDSTVQLELEIRNTLRTSLNQAICIGESYRFGARRLTQTGIYFDTLNSRVTGCDSVIRLDLTVQQYERNVVNNSICQGQSYSFDGKSLRNPGVYVDTLRSTGVCPVIFELRLKVNPVYQDTTYATICQGARYTFGLSQYTQSGLYTYRLKTALGCDSLKLLRLKVLPSYRDTMHTRICAGDTLRFGQLKLYQEGAHPIRFNTRDGCDSILVVNIKHYPLRRDTFPVSICAGDTFRLGRLKYHQTGMYPITLRDQNSCDSTLFIQVVSHPRYRHSFSQMACEGRVIRFGKQVLSRTGSYTETFVSTKGCDSVVTLQLQIEPIDTSVKQGGILLSASIDNHIKRYEWINCDTRQVVSRQSSPFFLPERNGRYAVRLYTDTCVYVSGCHSVQLTTANKTLDFSAQIQYFPNPSSTEFQVQLPEGLTGQYHLSWINAAGKIIRAEKKWLSTTNVFSTTGFPNGLYVLRLQKIDESAGAVLKFIKAE